MRYEAAWRHTPLISYDGEPRLHLDDYEVYGPDILTMIVSANQFMTAYRRLQDNDHWDDILNGMEAADFENRNIIGELRRWMDKYEKKEKEQ